MATAALAGASGHGVSAAAPALATLALVIFLAIYRVSKPVNTGDLRNTKGPQKRGLLRKRLKGLEPSTFCMASGSSRSEDP
jgi:hypothetical protein